MQVPDREGKSEVAGFDAGCLFEQSPKKRLPLCFQLLEPLAACSVAIVALRLLKCFFCKNAQCTQTTG